MNFNHVWAAIASAPRTNTMLLALMFASAVVGALIALYISVPLACEHMRQYIAKRARRKARRRARTAAPHPARPETARRGMGAGSAWSRKSVGALVTCSLLVLAGVVTVGYLLDAPESSVLRAGDAEAAQGTARLRIDYELRAR